MPARKKPEGEKQVAIIPVRVTPKLKEKLEKLAEKTGVSTSSRAREFFEKLVE